MKATNQYTEYRIPNIVLKIRAFFRGLRSAKGQLLLEVLISITVGGLFLIGATLAIVSLLRYNFESRIAQVTAFHAADIMNKLEQLAASNWQGIWSLPAGDYYVINGTTTSYYIGGQESILVDDVSYGLVGHWKLDETATITAYDSSGNMLTGTSTGDPIKATSSCMMGLCVDFDGDSYITIGNQPEVQITGAVTVSVWFYQRSGCNGEDNNPRIVAKGGNFAGGEEQFDMMIECSWPEKVTYGGLGFYAAGPGQDLDVGTTGTNPPPLNTWTHAVGVYEPSQFVRLYVNGVLEDEDTTDIPAVLHASEYPLDIGGKSYDAPWSLFDGLIDDVRVYARALSSYEVEQLYESRVNTRYFTIGNVYRDGNGDITEEPSGNTLDPSTMSLTVMATTTENKIFAYKEYVTRSGTRTFSQLDWDSGYGMDGPATSSPTGFATSSNITTALAGASLELATTTASGWLESTTYDTQAASGGALHSVLWQGTLPAGTVVKFQIAASNTSSGPWSYIGSDGTSGTYFTPSTADEQAEIWNVNNYRYFRYKVFLEPNGTSTPTVDDVHINWTP